MDKEKKRFMIRSFCFIFVVCVVVFSTLIIIMNRQTNKMVSYLNNTYIQELNTQMQQKFNAIVDLRLDQVGAVVKRTPPKNTYSQEVMDELKISADVREFSSLGFYMDDGSLEIIYGEDLRIAEGEDIERLIEEDGLIVSRGFTLNGDDRMLLVGQEADYVLADGRKTRAIIVGISMDYMNEAMFMNEKGAMTFSNLVDLNGNFIIRNGDIYQQTYFDRLRDANGKNGVTGEELVENLRQAMKNGQPCRLTYYQDKEERHAYCTPLRANSDWYLITIMHHGKLAKSVIRLDRIRMFVMLCAVLLLLGCLLIIFRLYYKILQQQMKELYASRQEAVNANMAKSEFLSSMSHDIRTPMNAIIGMTDIAGKSLDDIEKVGKCLNKIRLSSTHLLGLINDVLDMSKIESGKMTLNMSPISLRDAMGDLVNIIQQQIKAKNQYFDIFIHKIESEVVCCDLVRLNQVLLNLLSNAVKFTPEGGRIDIYMSQEASPKGDQYVRTHFRVVDTGIGMSPEFQKKIWDTFTREENDQVSHIVGTGLGTAISKNIVDLMGGTIEVKSEQGKGSEFHIILDLERSDKTEDEIALPPWNVLVVDDNEMLCVSAVHNLEELGVHAEWTMDGRDAIRMIEERHQAGDDYRIVLVDWKMPNMDGIQTIHEIRERVGMDVPIFLMSAYDWSDIEEEIESSDIEGFIAKPLFKSTLYDRLKQYVEGYEHQVEENREETVDFHGKHILLSEDIELNWEVASELLSGFGLELDWAVNGQVCLEMFEQSEVGYYDAILMDIRMPVMNGYDSAKAIRALDRPDSGLPIIAMTADAFSDDAKRAVDSGMNAHIPKPIDIKECIRVLQKYLT